MTRDEQLEWAEHIKNFILLMGGSVYTAYIGAGLFIQGIENENRGREEITTVGEVSVLDQGEAPDMVS